MRIQSLRITASPNKLAKAVSAAHKIALVVHGWDREDAVADIVCSADDNAVTIHIRANVVGRPPIISYVPTFTHRDDPRLGVP